MIKTRKEDLLKYVHKTYKLIFIPKIIEDVILNYASFLAAKLPFQTESSMNMLCILSHSSSL